MYRINGYDLFLAFGILPDADRTTADSFENPIRDMAEVFSYTWPDGVVEYDLQAPVKFKPRVFTIKGTLIVDNQADYEATKDALSSVIHAPYVTLEMVSTGIKVNARIRNGGSQWNRITHLEGKIAVKIQMQFDEVMQEALFIDNGQLDIVYYVDDERKIYTTMNDENYIANGKD